MKSSVLLLFTMTSILFATSIKPGEHYQLFRDLFRNHHYAECDMLGKKLINQYPSSYRNSWCALYRAISVYKMEYRKESIQLLQATVDTYPYTSAAMHAELILFILTGEEWSNNFEVGAISEITLVKEVIRDMSLSSKNIEKYLNLRVTDFLNFEIALLECDSLKQELFSNHYIKFSTEELPLVLSLISLGVRKNNIRKRNEEIHVEAFIALFLVETDNLKEVPLKTIKINKKLYRLSRNNSKVSHKVKQIYNMLGIIP